MLEWDGGVGDNIRGQNPEQHFQCARRGPGRAAQESRKWKFQKIDRHLSRALSFGAGPTLEWQYRTVRRCRKGNRCRWALR